MTVQSTRICKPDGDMAKAPGDCGDQRRPYSKPQLRCFGRVRELTQGGTGGPNESAADAQQCNDVRTRRFNPNCPSP